jgi:ATP-dependent helicase/nuclease subunit A
VTPSLAAATAAGVVLGEIVRLPTRIPSPSGPGFAWNEAGDAIHAFFAADPAGAIAEERLRLAERLLARAGLLGHVAGPDLVRASDALGRFIDSRWPRSRQHREIPITAFQGPVEARRRIEGRIDVLVETGAGDIIIDHKISPDRGEQALRDSAVALAPQLLTYVAALRLLGRPVAEAWFHFPLSGALVPLLGDHDALRRAIA